MDDWIWHPQHSLFYHPPSNLWAQYDPLTCQYNYLPTEREEGEISDEDDPYDDASRYAFPSTEPVRPSTNVVKPYDLRLVKRSSSCLSSKHKLAILASSQPDGYSVGRDKQLAPEEGRIRLKELEVSKSHAVVYYMPPEEPSSAQVAEPSGWGDAYCDGQVDSLPIPKEETVSSRGTWWVVDSASTHGTYVSKSIKGGKKSWKRLSESKKASLPRELEHGDALKVGSTTFDVHLHPTLPCSECSLSDSTHLIPTSLPPTNRPTDNDDAPSIQHPTSGSQPTPQDHMRQLRDTLLARPVKRPRPTPSEPEDERAGPDVRAPSTVYQDRAALRRQLRPSVPGPTSQRPSPSSTPIPPTAPSPTVQTPLAPTNIGHAMLLKHGWKPGTGLGATEQGGRVEPIEVARRPGEGKRGLGVPQDEPRTGTGLGWREEGKAKRWKEMGR